MPRPALLVPALALLLLAGLAGSSVRAATITLRADPWCPFNCRPDSDRPGFLIEVARAVFEPLGHRIDYRTMGWRRTIEAVRRGEVLGAVGAAVDDAPDLIFAEEPAAFAVPALALRRGERLASAGPEALEGRVVGAILGYELGTPIDRYLARHARDPRRVQWVSGVDGAAQNLRKLLAGRIDAAYDDASVLAYTARGLGLAERIETLGLGVRQAVGIGFSPARGESRLLARQLAEGLRRLRASGELAALEARYGLAAGAPEPAPGP